MKRFQREIEEENDIYSMFFFLKTKNKGEWFINGQRKEFLETLRKINFGSKKELIEKIGWQWKAL